MAEHLSDHPHIPVVCKGDPMAQSNQELHFYGKSAIGVTARGVNLPCALHWAVLGSSDAAHTALRPITPRPWVPTLS